MQKKFPAKRSIPLNLTFTI